MPLLDSTNTLNSKRVLKKLLLLLCIQQLQQEIISIYTHKTKLYCVCQLAILLEK